MLPVPSAQEFQAQWSAFNETLAALAAERGLPAAFDALYLQQKEAGFIRDDLAAVERHSFFHEKDPGRFFRAQYNPRRAARFQGAGRKTPPPHVAPVHGGCFLCRENIRWQQGGRQLGYDMRQNGGAYRALMNPFPLMPHHVVIATEAHRPQEWRLNGRAPDAPMPLIRDLVGFAARLPGYVGFYNGVGAGASIPSHMHFQFFRRPEDRGEEREDVSLFPLEVAARRPRKPLTGTDGQIADYPLAVVVWQGAPETVIEAASRWLLDWAERNAPRLARLTGNFIAIRETTAEQVPGVSLYFVARDREKPRPEGFSGLVGGLEAMGEVVLSSAEEKARLDAGQITYDTIWEILAGVRTDLFPDDLS